MVGVLRLFVREWRTGRLRGALFRWNRVDIDEVDLSRPFF